MKIGMPEDFFESLLNSTDEIDDKCHGEMMEYHGQFIDIPDDLKEKVAQRVREV
jgi:predicted small metal-binding protein